MAALLRSGKFIRMVTGLTRQQVSQPSPSPQAVNGPTSGAGNGPDASSTLPIPIGFDGQGGASFQAWSLQHLHSSLPALSSVACMTSSERDREDKSKDPLLEFLSETKTTEGQSTVKEEPSQAEEKESGSQKEVTSSTKGSITSEPDSAPVASSTSQGLNLLNDTTLEWEGLGSKDKNDPESEDSPDAKTPPPLESVPYDQHVVPVVPLYESALEQTTWYPLPVVCQMFRQQGRYWDLECLLEGSRGIRPEDRRTIYFWTLQAYADVGLYDRAVGLSAQLHHEGLGHQFSEYHQLMSSFAAAQSYLPVGGTPTPTDVSMVTSPHTSCSATPAPPAEEAVSGSARRPSLNCGKPRRSHVKVQVVQRRFKKSLAEGDVKECLKNYKELKGTNRSVNVTELSNFIELLINEDQVSEATGVARDMLSKDVYPMPKIFRFLLNRLASNGDVSAMTTLGQYLTSRVKKEVSFDNRLCNAYLASGRGAEYLQILIKELDQVMESPERLSEDRIQSLKDKFPRGGAMGLLESDPTLVDSYTQLAHKFLELGYVAPMNVLWTYHFIGGRHDLAMTLWDKYVKTCPQIMFQKVCQTARARSDADLAQGLVDLLEKAATVTVGARGIAYSCLLDVLTQRQEYVKGVKALEAGLKSGLRIDDVNRTALKRLKEGLKVTTGQDFPFDIPKKSSAQQQFKDGPLESGHWSSRETSVVANCSN